MVEDQKLSGTIEFNETHELESLKGSKTMIRKARKRGASQYRGLSHEQICIVTTTDRNGMKFLSPLGMANQLPIA